MIFGKMKTLPILLMLPMLLSACHSRPAAASSADPVASVVQAAEQGDAKAQMRMGIIYDNGLEGRLQDYAQAARWYRMAALQGLPEAQNNLAVLYKDGQGLPQDYALAAHWFTLAARQGNVLAQSNLGWLYQSGNGVAQDFDSARHWYLLAACQGHAAAQNNLATMYRDGQGLKPNADSARYWFEQAARQGMKLARRNLDRMNDSTITTTHNE